MAVDGEDDFRVGMHAGGGCHIDYWAALYILTYDSDRRGRPRAWRFWLTMTIPEQSLNCLLA
jgi:hypothetical protein